MLFRSHATNLPPAKEESGGGRRRQLLTLSAKTGSALEAMTGRLAEHLRETAEINLGDVAYTLQVGRREFGERRVVVCENAGEAIAGLQSLDAKKVFSSTREARKRPVVFLFPGVGEQYGNMAAGLYEEEGEFRTLVDECCELLQRETGVDLRTILFAEKAAGTGSGDLQKLFFRGVGDGEGVGERLNQTWLAQPAVFVIEYCLARLLMSWGIVPEALIGNSVGEYAAAVIAGVMSLGDGLRLVAGRGKLIEKLGGGAMLAVALGEEQLQPLLGEKLSIAISNGPKLTVVSGTEEAIAELEVTLQQKEMVSRRLQTRHAFHSRMMEPAYGEFVKLVETVELKAPQIPYISNVTGSWIKEEEARDAHYWARHMCQRVRFGEGISEILRGGEKVLVEVGPGQGLGSVVKQHPEYQRRNETVVISTMRTVYGREADQEVLLGALGKLWLAGTEIDWATYYRQEKRRRIPLPTYPFERQSFWLQPKKQAVSLYSRIASTEEKAELAKWFYVPGWKRGEAVAGGGKTTREKHCLVFADEGGLGEQIAEKIKGRGVEAVLVRPGGKYGKKEDGSFEIRVGERGDYSALLKELRKSGKIPQRMVHLWTVGGGGEEAGGGGRAGLEEKLGRSFYSLFYLAQAIGDQLTTEEIELCVISSDMQEVTGEEELCPEKATVKGPCKVIRQEYANVSCRSLDISYSETEAGYGEGLAEQLTEEMWGGSREQFVALRQGERWTQHFEQVEMEAVEERSPRLREGGVYLITGGLGGVGFAFAEYMFRTVGARLVLVGRTGTRSTLQMATPSSPRTWSTRGTPPACGFSATTAPMAWISRERLTWPITFLASGRMALSLTPRLSGRVRTSLTIRRRRSSYVPPCAATGRPSSSPTRRFPSSAITAPFPTRSSAITATR